MDDEVSSGVATSPIYLDHHATTPLDPRVREAMQPWWEGNFANPGSSEYELGRLAGDAVEEAREHVAALLKVQPSEIVFTSGATEANNLAIKGFARYASRQGDQRRGILTSAIEHKCVLEAVRDLAEEGFEPGVMPVSASGLLRSDTLQSHLADGSVLLVSVMAVNNEIGTIQDIPRLAALTNDSGAAFHTDAAQAFGRVPLDLKGSGVALASLSAHKVYGPKGVGALFVRRRPRIRLQPLFSGGGQERGLRSGTLPTPLIVGFGEAARIAKLELEHEAGSIAALRDRLLGRLCSDVPGLLRNGDPVRSVAGNLNLTFPGISSAQAMLRRLGGLCVSTGSACSSAEVQVSYVLQAIGLPAQQARSTLRIGIGRFTSLSDIDRAAAMLAQAWREASAETTTASE
ncbi:cysteine desulfurase family protein [Pseudoroseomonas globiformis]|uniref:Cysteine desulfurase n=1 Tax=Teichococcus globiformis TaxID=2307229 RepID=A0ABV7FZC9_9PROT